MTNEAKGELTVNLKGQDFTLYYDWEALGRIESELGDTAIAQIESGSANISLLAGVFAIGCQTHHPDFTKEDVMKLSPPLAKTIKAVVDALKLCYFGNENPEDFIESEEGDTAKKKPESKQAKNPKNETK